MHLRPWARALWSSLRELPVRIRRSGQALVNTIFGMAEESLLTWNTAEPCITPLIGGMSAEHCFANLSTLLLLDTSHFSTAILAPRPSNSLTRSRISWLSSPLREARMMFLAPCPTSHFVIAWPMPPVPPVMR